MKVCTDACVFGAWVASRLAGAPHKKILDIGAGTGLLMMMLAQQLSDAIDGVEIDKAAYGQLCENISQNEWRSRLRAFFADIRNLDHLENYDAIISNPPFYENDLLSATEANQTARHSTKLTLEELVAICKPKLNPNGRVFLLIPCHRRDYLIQKAGEVGLFFSAELVLAHADTHPPFRVMMEFSIFRNEKPDRQTLRIYDSPGQYSDAFIDLLKPYYLYL